MPYRIFAFLLLFTWYSCASDTTSVQEPKQATSIKRASWQPPASGTVVAQYQKRITEDHLNEKYFRVTVTTTELSSEGEYNLKLESGFNINETKVELPKWTDGIIVKPVLKEGPEKYHCLLGFDIGDGQFHEMYEIKDNDGNIKLKQIKGYYSAQ